VIPWWWFFPGSELFGDGSWLRFLRSFLLLQVLSDDYSKVVFLCSDRSLSFHARFGTYFKTRTPRQVR
jgi:hypothetical protein